MKKSGRILVVAHWVVLVLAGCSTENKEKTDGTANDASTRAGQLIHYGVVKTYPHDTTAFTEGLLVHGGKLYESTGSPADLPHTRSLVGEVDLSTGQISKKVELDRTKYFGEGIVFLKDKLYQLTYQTKIGFIYDAATFRQTGTFPIPSAEGWGLTTDGTYLIMSDGTQRLTFLDSATYAPVKTLEVYDQNGGVVQLNELEWINGFIYANIYTTSIIAKIDPRTGQVMGKLDLTSLTNDAKSRYPEALELNGIAFDPATRHIYVTGKLWPSIYQIQFDH